MMLKKSFFGTTTNLGKSGWLCDQYLLLIIVMNIEQRNMPLVSLNSLGDYLTGAFCVTDLFPATLHSSQISYTSLTSFPCVMSTFTLKFSPFSLVWDFSLMIFFCVLEWTLQEKTLFYSFNSRITLKSSVSQIK